MPIKKLEKTNPNVLKFKVGFLIVLILTALAAQQFLKPKKPPKSKTERKRIEAKEVLSDLIEDIDLPSTDDIKGLSTTLTDQIDIKGIEQQAEETKEEVFEQTQEYVDKQTSEASKQAADFFYDQTLDAIMEKIYDLPEDQQIKIKEKVCEY